MSGLDTRTDGPIGQLRRVAIGDGPEQASSGGSNPATSPRAVSTTRAATSGSSVVRAARSTEGSTEPATMRAALNEKERVYEELDRMRRKLARSKRALRELQNATSAKEASIARMEATAYRQALSNIAYRLEHDNGFISDETLRQIVSSALLLRGLKARDRRRVERAREDDGR